MPSLAVCTIVSNNYLPYARVFARSFLEHHPDGRVFTLIVDGPGGGLRYDEEPFEPVFAHELDIPSFESLAFRYSILELNTAVKPFFLSYLGDRFELDRLCYFDPDILVTESLSRLFQYLDDSNAVLTPHILQPIEDDKIPSERDFLQSGIYNLGFVGFRFSAATRDFLEWWQRRLHRYCLHRVEEGLFVDQRWMDFAPALLPRVRILREPGYNVAYWNLVHRRLQSQGSGWTVEGEPLYFFHFSGFDPEAPGRISKYQNRLRLKDREDLTDIFSRYTQRLLAEEYGELRQLSYGYGQFDNGVEIPRLARHLLQEIDPKGDRWPSPFQIGDNSFYEWLRESVVSKPDIPRIAMALWDHREDLERAFPVPTGSDATRYAAWYVQAGAREVGLDDAFVEATRVSLEGEKPAPWIPSDLSTAERARRRIALLGTGSSTELGTGLWSELSPGEVRWLLNEDDEEPSPANIPRIGLLIHRQRRDLQRVFPMPLNDSKEEFVRWLSTYGRVEYAFPKPVVRRLLRGLPFSDRLYARLWWWGQRVRQAAAG